FMDEIAQTAGIDLPELMRRTLGAPRDLAVVPGRPVLNSGRARAVIDGVCKMAGWQGGKLAPGPKGEKRGRGFGFYFSHRGYFAEVVDVTITEGTNVRVDKVWACGDIGSQIINPINARHQVQGAVNEGLGQGMVEQKIEQVKGVVQAESFGDFPLIRIEQVPREIA
ncbi:hypothetical protein KXX12_008504, partial [Aspergillus fumigatus]